ncbi:MAG TPA: RelA/SpoT domain-containing protein, partial [Sphingomicrobium sp.]|nr:RelA/SpoT domain-containing protein [Sphingomicrobium sp.]
LVMAWTTPLYSRQEVNAAGKSYISSTASKEEKELARAVINNWRSSHSFPLNTFQMNLRKAASRVDQDMTVARRIKRLPSIRHKLERLPNMKLSQMQDLGGCRAILTSVDEVEDLADHYRSRSRIKHKLLKEYQYIQNPKDSGYRGIHLVYAYKSDEKDTYNGLRIEMQLRSHQQHAWATAVETVGTFTQQALKSSWGEADWLRFFALMSSAMAMREGRPIVPGTPEDYKALLKELSSLSKRLKVIDRLAAYGEALRTVEDVHAKRGHVFLLDLDIHENELTIRTFESALKAADEYAALEAATEGEEGKDVVLVSAESVTALQRAYPNYFLDTTAFLVSLRSILDD